MPPAVTEIQADPGGHACRDRQPRVICRNLHHEGTGRTITGAGDKSDLTGKALTADKTQFSGHTGLQP